MNLTNSLSTLPLSQSGRSGQRCIHVPAAEQPFRNGSLRNASYFRPLCLRLRLSTKRDVAVLASITHLGFARRPLAVLFAVWAIVIFAIQAASLGAVPHVFVEAREVVPSLAHGDSATSVVGERQVVGVSASLEHSVPCGVYGAPAHSVGNCAGGLDAIRARLAHRGPAASQVPALAHLDCSTRAAAFPFDLPAVGRVTPGNHSPVSECLVAKVDEFWHDASIPVRDAGFNWGHA